MVHKIVPWVGKLEKTERQEEEVVVVVCSSLLTWVAQSLSLFRLSRHLFTLGIVNPIFRLKRECKRNQKSGITFHTTCSPSIHSREVEEQECTIYPATNHKLFSHLNPETNIGLRQQFFLGVILLEQSRGSPAGSRMR